MQAAAGGPGTRMTSVSNMVSHRGMSWTRPRIPAGRVSTGIRPQSHAAFNRPAGLGTPSPPTSSHFCAGSGRRWRRRPKLSVAALPELFTEAAASPYRDVAVLSFAVVGALLWVKLFKSLAVGGYVSKNLSRKLVHSTAGPLLVLSWPLFSADPSARALAALVPLLNGLRLAAVGSGAVSDPGLVASVSRSGDRVELLGGPFYYCVVLVAATLLAWRDHPAGLMVVALMCGGDGLADIVGRKFGGSPSLKLPFNSSKSWPGSAAMLLGGAGMALGLLRLFTALGFMPCYSLASMLPAICLISLAATLVESLPLNKSVDDNISVPAVVALLSLLLLHPAAAATTAATTASNGVVLNC